MTTPPTDVVVRWTVAAADAELAALALWDHGATAVGESPAGGHDVALTASYPTAEAARLVASELGSRAGRVESVEVDGAWRDAWRAHATTVVVDGGLVVAPTWTEVERPDAGRTLLRIDPGHCFGSGSHPSSRLILGLLAADPPDDLQVLDVGTGSGILAVAAAVLGATMVVGVDIDPASPAVVAANAGSNGVADRVRAATTPVEDLPAGAYDLALVNVTAGVHVELAAATLRAVRPGGRLLLAGLLPGQWRHVAGAYPGREVVTLPELDGWAGAVLLR